MVLPAPVGPTIATVCTRPDVEAEILDERRVGLVAEGHVIEDDVAERRHRGRPCADVGSLLVGREELEHTLG